MPDHDGPVGAQLLKLAHELGADLLVMGAYAHGEWREALLGGVTRYVLDHAACRCSCGINSAIGCAGMRGLSGSRGSQKTPSPSPLPRERE